LGQEKKVLRFSWRRTGRKKNPKEDQTPVREKSQKHSGKFQPLSCWMPGQTKTLKKMFTLKRLNETRRVWGPANLFGKRAAREKRGTAAALIEIAIN